MLDLVFNAYFQVVPYGFFEGVMALIIICEVAYTFFIEPFDVL